MNRYFNDKSNYDKYPVVNVPGMEGECRVGFTVFFPFFSLVLFAGCYVIIGKDKCSFETGYYRR